MQRGVCIWANLAPPSPSISLNRSFINETKFSTHVKFVFYAKFFFYVNIVGLFFRSVSLTRWLLSISWISRSIFIIFSAKSRASSSVLSSSFSKHYCLKQFFTIFITVRVFSVRFALIRANRTRYIKGIWV